MRIPNSIKQPVFYRLYEGEEEIIDEYGNVSGSYIPKYGELKSAFVYVSPNVGTSETYQFGTSISYTNTMTTEEVDIPIDEHTVLWIGDVDTDSAWTHEVVTKSASKHFVSFAIKTVEISFAESIFNQIMQQEAIKLSLRERGMIGAENTDIT